MVSKSNDESFDENSDDQQYFDPERGLATWLRDDSQVTPAGSDCENEGRTAPPEDSDD